MKVAQFKDGSIVKDTKNPELGRLMIASTSFTMSNNFLNESNRLGFITMKHTTIKALGLDKEGADYNAALARVGAGACKIRVVESTTPFHDGQAPKMNPETKEVITDANGSPIYYSTEVVELSSGLEDDKVSSKSVVAEPVASVEDQM